MKVYVAATLRTFFQKQDSIKAEGSSVKEVLNSLVRSSPEAKDALFDENGSLREFIRIFIGTEDFTASEKWDEQIPSGKELTLLPVIAGGSGLKENGEQEKTRPELISDERRKAVKLDDKEIDRFSKHLMLKEIGVKGQKRFKAARVAVFGAGALGAPVIQYLAGAGIGFLRIIDNKEVALSDLWAQPIHGLRDVNRPRSASAKDSIRNIDRALETEAVNAEITAENVTELIDGCDLVLDCTDQFKSRYLINDACAINGIPLIFGAVYQFEGEVTVLNAGDGPCLRCIFPTPPPPGLVPSCASGGTISPLPGIVGSIMANEALKLIAGIGESLIGRLLTVDSLYLRSSLLAVHKSGACPICGRNPTLTEVEDFDYEDFCGLKEDENELPVEGIEPEELASRIEKGEPVTIVDVREPHERAIHRFPNAIVIPIGQLARRQKELDPEIDTIFICKEGKRSILAINTLREAGFKGPMYNLKGGIDGAKDIIFSNEGAWL